MCDEASVGAGVGVGLTMEVGVGDEPMDAIEGRLGNAGGAGRAGGDERVEESLGVGEGVHGGAAVAKRTGEGGGGVGGGRRGRRRRLGEPLDEGFALVGELGVALAP